MQDIPFGSILLFIAFVVLPLINWLLRRFGRHFERQVPQEPPRQPAPRTYARLPPFDSAAAAIQQPPIIEVAEISPHRRKQPRNKMFMSRRDLRRAVLMMTVLGPCRAANPVDAERRQSRW